jgi:hypothetical protein
MLDQPLDQTLRGYRFAGGKPAATPQLGEQPWSAHAPFAGACEYHRSLYWWWWHSLQLVPGYRTTCMSGGKRGDYKKLYEDFGNVHEGTFHDWFLERGGHLFAEPRSRRMRVLKPGELVGTQKGTLCVFIPLSVTITETVGHMRKLLNNRIEDPRRRQRAERTSALYPLASRTRPKSIHQALTAWQARQCDPKITLFKIAQLLHLNHDTGSPVNDRARMESDAAKAVTMGTAIMTHVALKDKDPGPRGSVSEFPVVR